MWSFAHKKFIFIVLLFFILLLGTGYYLLSKATFSAGLVAEKVALAFAGSGYKLDIRELHGNPLTGVTGVGVMISHEGVVIANASEIEMRPSLFSVATSKPKLSRLAFNRLLADYDVISAHIPESDGSSDSPALDSFVLYDSVIKTQWGSMDVKKGAIFIGPSGYRFGLRGKYKQFETSLLATIKGSPEGLALAEFRAQFGEARFEATGQLAPFLSIIGGVEGLDVGRIADSIPELKKAGLSGVFDSKFAVVSSGDLIASADISSLRGSAGGLAYEALKASLNFRDRVLSVSLVDAIAGRAVLKGDARIDINSDEPYLSLKFSVRSLDAGFLREAYPWAENFSGVIDFASCDLAGSARSLSGVAMLSSEKLNISDFDVEGLRISANLKKSSVVNLSFSGKYIDASLTGSGDIGVSPETTFNVSIAASPISLAAVAEKYPRLKDAALSGVGSGTLRINGRPSNPVFSGYVDFPTLVVSDEYKLSGVKGEFEYAGSRFSVKGAEADWSGAKLKTSGYMGLGVPAGQGVINFSGSLAGLALESLSGLVPKLRDYSMRGDISGGWGISGSTSSPNASFDLTMPKLDAGDIALTGMRLVGSYQGGLLDVKKAAFSYGKATFAASGDAQFSSGEKSPLYNVRGSFAGLDPAMLGKLGILSGDLTGNVDGDVRVWRNQDGEGARAFFRSSDLSYDNLRFSAINGQVAATGGRVTFDKLRSNANIGNLTVNGSIDNVNAPDKGDIALNVSLVVESADIGRISRLLSPSSRGYQGYINCSADIKGTGSDPKFSADGNIQGVRAFGLFLPVIRFDSLTGNLKELHLPHVRVIVGRGAINLDADMSKRGGEWGGSVNAIGRSVDIRSLTIPIDYDVGREIHGALDFDFKGKGSLSSFEGKGTAHVPSLSVMGINFTDFEAPFWVTEGYVVVEESKAKAYGGVVTGQVAKDLRLSDWGGTIDLKNADFSAFLKDAAPDASGTVAGSADFKLSIAGDTKRTSMQTAEGSLEIKNGEVAGFKGTAAVSTLIGGRPLRFNSLLASFTIDGKTIYLLPGSRVQAPKGDPVFNYIMADGSLTLDKEVNIYCVGNVNIKALNSFIGGVNGLISSAMEEGTSGLTLENFLGGAIRGFSKDEFRDVSLAVKGISDDIAIRNIKIAEPPKTVLAPELNDAERRREKDDERIRLNLEFPVGPGEKKRGGDLGGQVGGQMLEQALGGLLSF